MILCNRYQTYIMDPRRLTHISDLPNNLNFLPIEIKHLLPVHHPKFIDNLHTIISHQAQLQQWPVYPDNSLTLSNPHYGVLSGGWCEDIDGNDQHLKSSLELSAIVLNYLNSLLQNVRQDQQSSNSTMIHRVDHIGSDPAPIKHHFQFAIAYNIYKTKDKGNKTRFIFIVGEHRTNELRMYAILSTFRSWNLHRLKCDMCIDITPTRIHSTIKHLLIILRSFLPLSQEDHQAKQRDLQCLIEQIDHQSLPKEIPRDGIQSNQQVVLSRFEWTYKTKIQPKDIILFNAEVLSELLKIMPLTASCSFAGKGIHEPKQNQYVLLWMTCFQRNKNHKYADNIALQTVRNQTCTFLRKKVVESIKDSTTNIADQMLKSSLKVLSRYATGQQRSIKDLDNQSQSLIRQSSFKSSAIVQKPRVPDFDRMSVLSRVSFKDTQSGREGRQKVQAKFQSLSSPLKAHRDQQYAQLLAQIKNWQKLHGNITPWSQLRSQIKQNCQTGKLFYNQTDLTSLESQLLLSLAALRRYLDIDQFLLLLKYHTEHRESIFQIIFQHSAANFLHNLGIKIAKEYAQPLYQKYLTQQFTIDNNNLLTIYLKKIVTTFVPKMQPPTINQQINVAALIDLLEHKELSGQTYRQLARTAINQLFLPNKPIMLISPILYELYHTLANDHHEELVNGLLGDLTFETIYFCHQTGRINNSPYRRDQDLRQKKLLQLLRVGGFNTLSYQLKQTLTPLIFQYAHYCIPSSKIYEQVVISRPLQLNRFVQLLTHSTFIQHLTEVVAHFSRLQYTANTVTRPIGNVYLQSDVAAFKWEQEQDVTSGVSKSESGIFKQLLQYNPQIKLAGRSLREVVNARESQKTIITPQRFDSQYILTKIVTLNLQEIYQYIVIVGNLKSKYDVYDTLKQDQRIYLREIVHQVLCRKTDIFEYLDLALLAKYCREMEVHWLF